MSELRSRILEACTLHFGGVTGVTHVTEPGTTAKLPSRYACYAPLGQSPEKDGTDNRLQGSSSARLGWDAADWHAYFEERAAIREYDGRVPRLEAEGLALQDVLSQWAVARPYPSLRPSQYDLQGRAGTRSNLINGAW